MRSRIFFTVISCIALLCSQVSSAQTNNTTDSLYQVLKTSKDTARIKVLIALASKFHYTNTAKSNELAEEALQLSRKLGYTIGIAYALNNKGMNYDYSGQLNKSIECYLEALKIVEDKHLPVLSALILSNISAVYFYKGDFQKAVEYGERSLKILEQQGRTGDIAARLLNLGAAYGRLKKYDTAQKAYDRALDLFTRANDKKNMAGVLTNMGILIHRKEGMGKNALPYYLRAQQLSKEINDPEGLLTVGMNIAAAYSEVPDFPKAIAILNECLDAARQTHFLAAIIQVYAGLAEVYKSMGNFEKAYTYMEMYANAHDSLLNESSQKQILELETKYKTAQKEKELQAQQAALHKSQNNLFAIAIIAIVAVFSSILVVLYFRRRKIVATELEKAKSVFFSNIAHDFRTPIALITGPIEHIMQESQDAKLNKQLSVPLRNAHHLLKLINELLDVSKMEAGEMKTNKAYGDMRSFVSELVGQLMPIATEKGVILSFSSNEAEIEATFDGNALEKIVFNLVTNAVKFTPAGGAVKVNLSVDAVSKQVLLSVKDTGIGISANDQKELFNRFFRSKDVQAIPGVGLGLSLVKDLVKLNEGTITLTSDPGMGCEFMVTLPLYQAAPAQAHIADAEEGTEHEGEEPLIAVVVEDNVEMLSFVSSLLSGIGITVYQCADGKTGLAKCQEIVPDIIVTDVMLPDIDGYAVCDAIKKNVATDHIPVVMLTARTAPERRMEGLLKGADAYITKPFNPQELTGYIQNLLSLRRNVQKRLTVVPKAPTAQDTTTNTLESLRSLNNQFVNDVLNIIEKNLAEEAFSIDDLSKEMFLSRAQFHRKLKMLTGFSASPLIRTIRLEQALQLLKANAGSVTDIAFRTGFNSQPYFTKCFTQHFGYSPKEVKSVG